MFKLKQDEKTYLANSFDISINDSIETKFITAKMYLVFITNSKLWIFFAGLNKLCWKYKRFTSWGFEGIGRD